MRGGASAAEQKIDIMDFAEMAKVKRFTAQLEAPRCVSGGTFIWNCCVFPRLQTHTHTRTHKSSGEIHFFALDFPPNDIQSVSCDLGISPLVMSPVSSQGGWFRSPEPSRFQTSNRASVLSRILMGRFCKGPANRGPIAPLPWRSFILDWLDSFWRSPFVSFLKSTRTAR